MAKKKKLIIIGAGGHARSVIENAPENTFLGYVAPEPAAIAFGLPYEGDDGYIIANSTPMNSAFTSPSDSTTDADSRFAGL